MLSLWMLKSPLEILVNVQLQVKIFHKTDPLPKLVYYQDHASQSCLANSHKSRLCEQWSQFRSQFFSTLTERFDLVGNFASIE